MAVVGDQQLRYLTPAKVEAWFRGLLAPHTNDQGRRYKPIQASTFNFYRLRLASLFRYCSQRSMIRHDPLLLVEPLPIQRKRRQQPSPTDLLRLLDASGNARDRGYIAVAINTALRSCEIVRLRVATWTWQADGCS